MRRNDKLNTEKRQVQLALEGGVIALSGLPPYSTLYLYSIAGELLHKLETDGEGAARCECLLLPHSTYLFYGAGIKEKIAL